MGNTAAMLAARALDPAVCASLGMWTHVGKGGGEALAIDFRRKGQTVNTKFRTLDAEKRMWQTKGGVYTFWNEDCLRDDGLLDRPLIMTEGELDGAAAVQAGFLRTVSVPCGAPEEPLPEDTTKYRFLEDPEVRPLLATERVREIILATDGDGPGAALMQDLSVRLGRFRCKYLTYPKRKDDPSQRCKDLNEVLQMYGPEGVQKTIERAQWLRVDGVYRMSELPPVPMAPIYEAGMKGFDDHYKVRLGDISIWTGIPSHGKSSAVNDVCCRLVQRHGLKIGFASFEQMPQRDHRRNLRTWFLRKPVQYAMASELRDADKWIDDNFAFLVPGEDDDVTLDWALDRMEAAVVQFGVKVMVIDPWNEMDHARERAESLTEYTGRAIKALRRFAKKMMVHLIVVAHPSKQMKDENGDYRVPTLYDISDSAHWYNKADLGVVVHRKKDYTILRVAKSRYHDEIGTPGEVFMTYCFEERRFELYNDPKAGPTYSAYDDE